MASAAAAFANLSKGEHDEACVTYAALLLHDAGAELTSDKLAEVISASGNQVDGYWCPIFAKMLKEVNVGDLITAVGSPGGGGGGGEAPAGGAAPADAGAAAGGKKDDKKDDKKEKKEEKKEEEVDVGGGNLFGDAKADGY